MCPRTGCFSRRTALTFRRYPTGASANEPACVALVAERLAQLRGVAVEALAEACFANACQVFGWEEDE